MVYKYIEESMHDVAYITMLLHTKWKVFAITGSPDICLLTFKDHRLIKV